MCNFNIPKFFQTHRVCHYMDITIYRSHWI